jgi:predicted NUDIX family phosphoesterase
LGIGGHIRAEDMTTESIFDWASREFHEEVLYNGTVSFEPLGVLNDDSNDVGKVHIGLVLLIQGDHGDISIQSELKSGIMLTLDEMKDYYDNMESWSQTVYDFLVARSK